jgi:hypothetical protein
MTTEPLTLTDHRTSRGPPTLPAHPPGPHRKLLWRPWRVAARSVPSGQVLSACALLTRLQNTATLTYVDLRCNDITDRGLATLTRHVTRHQTLRFLLVDSNPFNSMTAIDCQRRIELSGSVTQLKWTSRLGLDIDSLPDKNRHSHCSPLFTISAQVPPRLLSPPLSPVRSLSLSTL